MAKLCRRRSLLHKSKLLDFETWCLSQGWQTQDTNGPYLVLRMKKQKEDMFVYAKLSSDHLTLFDNSLSLYYKWRDTL